MAPRTAALLAALAVAALAAAVGPAQAAPNVRPPWSLEDIGTGAPEAVNCSEEDPLEGKWLEITQILNFTQYTSTPNSDLSGVPEPLPFPYSLSAKNTRAPGFLSTCFSKSPSAPMDCEGDDCNVFLEEFGVKWLEFAILECLGSYPTPNTVNFFTNPTPPPGNVALIMTQQCKNYFYSAQTGFDFFYSVTDEWGNKWAMQTSQLNLTTEEDWDAMVDEVVLPEGWSAVEKVPLNDTSIMHLPYLVGEACYIPVLKDNLFNTWHAYTYPEGGLTSGQGLFAALGGNCTRLDAQYTMAAGVEGAEAPSPDSAPTPAPTPASAALALARPTVLGALAAAVAGAMVLLG